ncbi:MAG: hypothetical protein PHV82_17520 [Victivallaceae bacterium]|nr:hypothetical protein [Victivallaceae bacterium]
MWYKGYLHYHSAFRCSEKSGSPQLLAEDLKKLGISFVFCAGDHGNAEGQGYWGMNTDEFGEYRDFCLRASEKYGFPFLPAPEIHLMFPPFAERHEHHCCIPMINYLPRLEYQNTPSLAAAYTRDIGAVLDDARDNAASVVLTHPCASAGSELFHAPEPLKIPEFNKVDYYELLTIRGLKYNSYSFAAELQCYLGFLKNVGVPGPACCMGVDSMQTAGPPSAEKRIIPVTWLYIEGIPSVESVFKAFNEKKSYSAYGSLSLEHISPVPSKNIIIGDYPEIHASIISTGNDIEKVEIYRNGIKIFTVEDISGKHYKLCWRENENIKNKNYIILVKAGNEYLVTSPINCK